MPVFRVRARHLCATAATVLGLGLVLGAQQPNAGTPQSKLTTVLADLAQSASVQSARAQQKLSGDALPKSAQDAIRARRLRINDNNEVQVYILVSRVDDDVKRQVTASGATIELSDEGRRRIQARIPVSRLLSVAQLPVVDAIRLPSYARHRIGAVTSEGDAIMQAAAARANFGVDGTGIRVGVASDGLKGVFATGCTTCADVAGGPIAAGDLPTSSGVRDANGVLRTSTGGIVGRSFQANGDLEGLPPATPACQFPGAGAEGTALLEIVHDLAPGAKLAFANGDTDLEFAQAVNFLAASNDIVVDDIGFLGEPYDGTSGVSTNTAHALNNNANPIRAYFTSVGNDADEHYIGAFTDSGVDGTTISGITTAGHLHLFQQTADTTDVLGLGSQPYNVVSLPQNGEIAIFLTWDDTFGSSGNNYDLYLVQQSTGRVVARSTDLQSGVQDPVEVIDYVNTGGQDRFRIVVQNVGNAAKPRTLNIFSFAPECAAAGPQVLAPPAHERHNYNTASRSVTAQGDAGGSPVSVMSVGAICSASSSSALQFPATVPDQSCLDTSNTTAEFFSSRGPTIDGRTKPDISGIDGVSVTGAGSFPSPFFGTSAAAPHMGGVAALYLQGAPCLLNRGAGSIDPAQARATVRTAMLTAAVPLGRSQGDPPNNTFGAGLGNAQTAVQSTFASSPAKSAYTFDGTSLFGATLTAAQLGFADPNGCSLTSLSWTGGCGTGPGSVMTCPVGTSSVAVRASNNGLAFSAEADLQITVTSYSMSVSPGSATVSAGQNTTFLITVAPQSGPFGTAITLGCSNLPAQAACTFNPPTVTPGASPVQSVLTISTVAPAASAPLSQRTWPTLPAGRLADSHPALPSMVWLAAALAAAFAAKRRGRWRAARWVSAGAIVLAIVSGIPRTTIGARSVAAAMDPGIAVFPDTLTFGSQTVGTVAPPAVIGVTNIGADPLTFSGITTTIADFATSTTCLGTLDAGASCAIAVTFTPTTTGVRTDSVSIADNATGAPHLVTLTGTGTAAPSGSGPTPTGSYNVTVSATAGTFVQTGIVVLSVQ